MSLVGILDADKEGFLRSKRSLIQTIGRAARNSQGRVILYGDQITKSMKEALSVTSERRKKQEAFNQENNIEPATISKHVSGGVIDILRGEKKKGRQTTTKKIVDQDLSAEAIDAKIKELKEQMKEAAKNLHFEEAAKLRDEIKRMSELRLIL